MTAGSLVKPAAANLLVQAFGQMLMLVAHVLVGRAAGAGAYGVFVYVLALTTLGLVIGKVGQDNVVLKYVPIYASASRWADLRAMLRLGSFGAFFASAVVAALLAIALLTWGQTHFTEIAPMIIGLAMMPILALSAIRANALLGFGRVVAATAPDYLVRPLVLIVAAALALFLDQSMSATEVVGAYAVACLLTYITGSYLMRASLRGLPITGEIVERPVVWAHAGFWMVLVSGAYQAFAQIDVVVIGTLLEEREAGIYAAASRLASLVVYGLVSLQVVVAPKIAAAYAERRFADLQGMLNRVAMLSVGFAVGLSLLLAVFAEEILSLFGAEFRAGSVVLRTLLLAHIANAATGVTGFLLTMTGHQKNAAIIVVACLGIDALLLFAIVPTFGLIGAATVTVTMTAVTHIALAMSARRLTGLRSWLEPKSLIATFSRKFSVEAG